MLVPCLHISNSIPGKRWICGWPVQFLVRCSSGQKSPWVPEGQGSPYSQYRHNPDPPVVLTPKVTRAWPSGILSPSLYHLQMEPVSRIPSQNHRLISVTSEQMGKLNIVSGNHANTIPINFRWLCHYSGSIIIPTHMEVFSNDHSLSLQYPANLAYHRLSASEVADWYENQCVIFTVVKHFACVLSHLCLTLWHYEP